MSHLKDLYAVMERNNYVILDTETTGLKYPAEICQVAVLDSLRYVLANRYVKTHYPIPAAATAIHGITEADLIGAQTWLQQWKSLWSIIEGRDVIVYNAAYDMKLMRWSFQVIGAMSADLEAAHTTWTCAMLAYAEFAGELSSFGPGYKWHKLQDACKAMSVSTHSQHKAIGDCYATFDLIHAMKKVNLPW